MKRVFLSAAVAVLLCGCATGGLATTGTFSQKMEAKETQAEDIYAAVYNQTQAFVTSGTFTQAQATAIELPVWNGLQVLRATYNAGQDITSSLASLQSAQVTAQAALPAKQ